MGIIHLIFATGIYFDKKIKKNRKKRDILGRKETKKKKKITCHLLQEFTWIKKDKEKRKKEYTWTKRNEKENRKSKNKLKKFGDNFSIRCQLYEKYFTFNSTQV